MRTPLAIIIILIAILIVGGAIFIYSTEQVAELPPVITSPTSTQTNQAAQYNFSQPGNVAINNPGLNPNIWYLIYEKPGSPTLAVQLDFSRSGGCSPTLSYIQCGNMSFRSGDRAIVQGVVASQNSVFVGEVLPAR